MSYGMQGNKPPMQGQKLGGGYKQGQMQQFTPEQMQLFQQMFGQVSPDSFTSRLAGGDQSMFQQLEAPAMKQFQQMQGDIGSRFSGMGMGSRRGSGFQNANNQQTSDFAQQLQSQRMGLQRQATQDLMSMSSDLLGKNPYENYGYKPEEKKEPWWKSYIQPAMGIAGAALGSFTPLGPMGGYAAGNALGSAFTK
jgi:hypothetical protein